MSLLKRVFGKQKEISGDDIPLLFEVLTVEREPVIITTGSLKLVTDLLQYEATSFQVRNTLSRDEVIYELKGKPLKVNFPYELTLFGGDSRLLGLGMVNGMHSLKLAAPQSLVQVESRGAYRVSSFEETPVVTFTSNEADILQAKLTDISMTGAGLRLDPRATPSGLGTRSAIIIDIRLAPTLRISTSAKVRHMSGIKLGLQFDDLGKAVKDRLFKFIVARRRDEYRALMRTQEHVRSAPVKQEQIAQAEDSSGDVIPPPGEREKPLALIVGEDQEAIAFLESLLGRKFSLIQSGHSFAEIRDRSKHKPDMALIELPVDNLERVSQMKKAQAMLPGTCVLMYFGENFTDDFRERFLGSSHPHEMVVDLQSRNKLMLFKQVERFFKERTR